MSESFPPYPPGRAPRGRLLFADDDLWVREAWVPLLEELGFEVVAVEDGAEALGAFERARAEGAPFETAILDVRMPRLHGTDLVGRLLAADGSLVVILASGFPREHLDAALFASGRVGFMQKPGQEDELLAQLELVARALA